ncbi:MAG: HD domain-containing protein [bacterium]
MSEEKHVISSDFFENTERLERLRMNDFSVAFNAIIKALRMYGAENDTVEKVVTKFFEVFKFFFISEPILTITYNGNDFLINDTRVRKKKSAQVALDDLQNFFTSLQIASMTFPSDLRQRELIDMVLTGHDVLKKNLKQDAVFDHIEKLLQEKKTRIIITRRDSSDDSDEFSILDKSQLARLSYRNLISDHALFKAKIRENRPMPLRKAMRNVQNIIDLMLDGSADSQESHLLTLASINSLNKKMIATHLANTTVLSIAAGIQLGIERSLLTRIGIAAYFHDIAIPEESKGENMEHSKEGFAILSRLNSLNFAMMEAAITSGLHHSTYTFEGEPVPPERPVMSTPLGEVIKVCDYYDLTTRWWTSRNTAPLKRSDAIEQIFKMADMKCFSHVTAKALFSALGIFPPGTVMRVAGKNALAYSIDIFKTTGQKNKAALLDSKMNFIGSDEFYPQELIEIPTGLHFKLPPKTIKSILDTFTADSGKENFSPGYLES